ncbi:class I SAM-dependent methyltransferase [Aestuariibacter sp. GS-14]|nr:class I SAM-dependent methyltransferase [Aestuariibacter sp. GS-14]
MYVGTAGRTLNVVNRTIQHYSDKAQHYFALYNSVDAEKVHNDWNTFLDNTKPGMALDVGAGSGRDANWLAQKGWQVIAVEPADGLRELAQHRAHNNVNWCKASLPTLEATSITNKQFDLILLSAVWMHLPAEVRPLALARLATLLSPSGKMYISLRFGPNDEARPMHPVSYEELEALASENRLVARNLSPVPTQDTLSRKEVAWVTAELIREEAE